MIESVKSLKNDKERIAFLEDYRNEQKGWRMWKGDNDLQRIFWQNDITDGHALVVEEEYRTILWPKMHMAWEIKAWYILSDQNSGMTFGDQRASRTMALELIKKLQKEEKNGTKGLEQYDFSGSTEK